MPSFVADSTVLVPGFLDVGTVERRLLILCLYGQMRYYAEFGADEISGSPEAKGGGVVHGPIDELRENAAHNAALLAERLPGSAPSDVLLVLSTPILDEFQETLRHLGIGLDLGKTAEHTSRLRFAAARLAASAPQISLANLPYRTGIRDCDLLIEAAAQARAEFVVSDSPRINPLHGVDVPYTGGDVRICSLEQFLGYTELATQLDDVDGSLLSFGLAL